MKKLYAFLSFFLIYTAGFSQVLVTSAGPFTENFSSLAATGTSSVLPTGWAFAESGTGANTTYAADAGATNSGNTYSYGTDADRAFGSLRSGSVAPVLGVSFVNNTSAALTSAEVAYTGEHWRLGALGRIDRLDFQYSTDATSLTTGTWTDVNSLDFTAPVTTGTLGALNGNLAANRSAVAGTISSLNVAVNAVIWFRWNDLDPAGADDGLAIDDFSVTFPGSVVVACTTPAAQPTALTFPTTTATSINGSFTAAAADNYLIIRSTAATLSATPADGTTYTVGTAFGGGTIIANGSGTTFSDNGLNPSTTYYYFIFALNNAGCTGGPLYATQAALQGSAATTAVIACTTPNAPTVLNLVAAGTFINGSFTAAAASRYLVVISTSAILSTSPVDGQVYTAGAAFGNGTVVSYATATTFSASGLTPATAYYIFVFSANDGCGGAPFYSTTSLTGTATTTNGNGIPTNYYASANGLTCDALKNALSTIITNGQLALTYATIDNVQIPAVDTIRNDAGTAPIIWDIYTNNNLGPEPFVFNGSQVTPGGFCGASSPGVEGVCWNKEHTFPRSFFKLTGSSYTQPTEADLFVVRATDIKTNSERGNLAYSVVSGTPTYQFPATTTTYPGVPILDKVGTAAAGGITGTAFEPSNTVKGDIARGYFYIATRYQGNVANWVSLNAGATAVEEVLDGTTGGGLYPSLRLPYLAMLYSWHLADPVDAKEANRNDLIFAQQNNRNPFVDHPEYAAMVFQCTGVVPVTLLDLSAEKYKQSAILRWSATMESSFSRFDVERSTDGISFRKIGEVAGQNLGNYNFTDGMLPAATVVYYRLKLIDLDGRSRTSKIVFVKNENASAEMSVYPNPAANVLNIKFAASQEAGVMRVSDVTGRTVLLQNKAVNVTNASIDVSRLAPGRYFLSVSGSSQLSRQSFVVIR